MSAVFCSLTLAAGFKTALPQQLICKDAAQGSCAVIRGCLSQSQAICPPPPSPLCPRSSLLALERDSVCVWVGVCVCVRVWCGVGVCVCVCVWCVWCCVLFCVCVFCCVCLCVCVSVCV